MKQAIKRTLGFLLAALLMCGIAPLVASAADVDITDKFTDPEFRWQVYVHIDKTESEPILDTDVAKVTELWVPWRGIQNLAGLEYFVNLQKLICPDNELTSLPALPSGLQELICYSNMLTSLPALPSGLTTLDCYDNKLTSLPALPTGLVRLACWNNQLAALPALPVSLRDLQCPYNKLTGFDLSPCRSLQSLDCRYNDMTSKNAVKGFSRWDEGEYGMFKYEPQNVPQVTHFWDSWSPVMQWILRIFFFGWIWM